MIEFEVAGISAVLEPSASFNATTELAGFLFVGTALGARGSSSRFYRHMGMNEMDIYIDTMQSNF